MDTIASRYAKALLELAIETDKVIDYQSQMKYVRSVVNDNLELIDFLKCYTIKDQDKKSLIEIAMGRTRKKTLKDIVFDIYRELYANSEPKADFDELLESAENAKNADALVIAENARVEEARQAAYQRIGDLQSQLDACVQVLERIKQANLPLHKPENNQPAAPSTDAVADEISANLEALMGKTEESVPKAEPRHPTMDTTTKFANLQFGRNYDLNTK